MTNIGFRKRSRSREDFGEEFFPLSKRINNLQISGEFTFTQIPINQPQSHEQKQHDTTHLASQHDNSNNSMPVYNPELSFQENPNYYRQNNLLYDLFIERVNRRNPAVL